MTLAVEFVYIMICVLSDAERYASIYEDQDQLRSFLTAVSEELASLQTLLTGMAALIAIPIMLTFFFLDREKEKQRGIVQNRKAPLRKYGAVVLIAVAMCVGLDNLMNLVNFSSISEGYEETAAAFYSAGIGIQVLCLGILAPAAEELVFRGLMFRRLREGSEFFNAALYSSLVFGLYHGNLVQMIYGFIMGLMLAYVYEKYGSFKAPLLAHIVVNLTAVLGTYYQLYSWMLENFLRVGIITVGCAAVASTMFVYMQKIDEKPETANTENGKENLTDL